MMLSGNKHSIRILGLSALLAMAAVANAEEREDGFYVSGKIQGEHVRVSGTDNLNLLYMDVDIGKSITSLGDGNIGVNLGLQTLASNRSIGGLSDYALFPTVWGETGRHRYSLGSPSSALADIIEAPRIGGSEAARALVSLVGLYFTDLGVVLGDDSSNYGVRYDGQYGSSAFSASVHRVRVPAGSDEDIFDEDLFDGDIYTAGYKKEIGNLEVAAGIEIFSVDDFGEEESVFLAIGYDEERYGGQLLLADSGIFDDDSGIFDDDITKIASAYFKPRHGLTLEATYADVIDSTIWGVAAEYEVLSGGFLGAGYIDAGSSNDNRTLVNLYFGWRFQ